MEDEEEIAEPFLKETLAHIDALDEGMKTYARGCLRRSILSSSGNIVSRVQYCPKVFILGRRGNRVRIITPEMLASSFLGDFLRGRASVSNTSSPMADDNYIDGLKL